MNICLLAQLDQHQTFKPVMVSVVSLSPTGGNLFFKDTLMLILYKNDRNVFKKTSIISKAQRTDSEGKDDSFKCTI